jgi:glycerol-3-phosphate dehydrogenase
MPEALARRSKAFSALASDRFDLLVVGGGINGAGIARDAAMRGLKVALVERGDFGSGTSSRSSKLIHGGLRYLQEGDIRLVLESVRERERLRRLAPHLVRPQEFIFPVYQGTSPGLLTLALGLLAYDLLAGLWRVKRHRMLGASAIRAAEPALRQDGLRGAGQYWDYRTDDARLVLETLLAAAGEGAVAVSYTALGSFVKEAGRIVGARIIDQLNGTEIEVRARVVVNATGPWVDTVTALDAPASARLRLTKGVHVVVPRARVGNRAALALAAVADGRMMFVIPWGAHALVGTTDTDHHGGPESPPVVEPTDIQYLLDTVNHYFPAARLAPSDVVSAFAGLRPLIASANQGAAPSSVSREEEIFVSASGLLSIAGGKLTTYRLVAAQVVDRAVGELKRAGDLRTFGRSRTGRVPLPGGRGVPETLAAAALSRDGHGLGQAAIEHLARRYGSRLDEVLGLVARDRHLGAPLLAPLPDPRAEVIEAVEREWALTIEDVLRRRTQVALRDPEEGAQAAGEAATLMAEALGWDVDTARRRAADYVEMVRRERRRWQ